MTLVNENSYIRCCRLIVATVCLFWATSTIASQPPINLYAYTPADQLYADLFKSDESSLAFIPKSIINASDLAPVGDSRRFTNLTHSQETEINLANFTKTDLSCYIKPAESNVINMDGVIYAIEVDLSEKSPFTEF